MIIHRRIALSTTAQTALKTQRRLQTEARLRAGPAWTDHGLVFTDEFGEPQTGSRVTVGLREGEILGLACWASSDAPSAQDRRHGAASLLVGAAARRSSSAPGCPGCGSTIFDGPTWTGNSRSAPHKTPANGLVFVTERGYAVNGSWLTKHRAAGATLTLRLAGLFDSGPL